MAVQREDLLGSSGRLVATNTHPKSAQLKQLGNDMAKLLLHIRDSNNNLSYAQEVDKILQITRDTLYEIQPDAKPAPPPEPKKPTPKAKPGRYAEAKAAKAKADKAKAEHVHTVLKAK